MIESKQKSVCLKADPNTLTTDQIPFAFQFEVKKDKEKTDCHCDIRQNIDLSHLSTKEIDNLLDKQMNEASGVIHARDAKSLFSMLGNTVNFEKGDVNNMESAISMAHQLKPQDPLEGMLIHQMISLHYHAMDALSNASKCKDYELKDRYLTRASKLCARFQDGVEKLAKWRGKGQQTITVQHLEMNGDSKAIIGMNGGGDNNKSGGTP